ncbi:MAG: hypothetical protein HY711_03595 [Candidatus Melainabacteria bacterium]|nr:hypothetical protein [Candidatus Melainabacteria bacterium]
MMEDKKKPEMEPKPEEKKKPRYQELKSSKHLDTKELKAVVGGGANIPVDSGAITRPSTPVNSCTVTLPSNPFVSRARAIRGDGRYRNRISRG